MQARQNYIEDKKTREESRVSPARPITDLEMGSRPTEALAKAGITTVGEFMAKLAEGEQAVLDIAGFGRKSFIDMKKKLRQLGYELPGGEEAA
ncbi:DNA-directed RNA polymerase subunit alpha C-terminal domain-containing protein [Levilinea saccharolytica]|uniref:DNA-directed RNA polymerase subunit alpha C-terminal domain-containing protein n=1 Tax=Levilinea saccharolytica TaxID=229921 RepID=UPI0034E2B75A